jgi:hypothetical protein
MRKFLFGLLLCAFALTCWSQQKRSAKVGPLTQCRMDNQVATDALITAIAERDTLRAENAQLQKHYNDAFAVLSVLNSEIHGWTPSEPQLKLLHEIPPDDLALSFGTQSETAVQKLAEHDSMAVEKYNALLSDYKEYVQQVDLQMAQVRQGYAQQQRFNNALALYNAMPKYTPPQTLNLRVMDCTKLPALCVGQ